MTMRTVIEDFSMKYNACKAIIILVLIKHFTVEKKLGLLILPTYVFIPTTWTTIC